MGNKLQRWRKPYLTILYLVTAVVIFTCVCSNFIHIDLFKAKSDDSTVISKDYDLDNADFSSICLDLSFGEATIKTGDSLSISANYPEKFLPTVSCKNGKLLITQDHNGGIDFSDIEKDCALVLIIPSTLSIDKVDLASQMGNIDAYDISCKKLYADCSMGDITIKNASCDEGDLDCDMGNINVNEITASNLDANCDLGNISILDATIGTGDLDCSMGNITFDGTYDSLDYESSLGTCNIN